MFCQLWKLSEAVLLW